MFLVTAKFFVLWWPGTESNRRRQPFQGCQLNRLGPALKEDKGLTRRRFGRHLDSGGSFEGCGLHGDSGLGKPRIGLEYSSRGRNRHWSCLL